MKVAAFFEQNREEWGLQLLVGGEGLDFLITLPEIERPGLGLAGFLKSPYQKPILVFGKSELDFLEELPSDLRLLRLNALLLSKTFPCVIVAEGLEPPQEMISVCQERQVPLLQSNIDAMHLTSQILIFLNDLFLPQCCLHGTFVEIFNIGVLILGDSAVGKSEAALGLVERGHRLISDDFVRLKKVGKTRLEGFGSKLSNHFMELRGVGIIDIAHLYGSMSLREKKSLDIVVKLEVWNDSHFYDRSGLEENLFAILGVNVPYYVLPVKLGRDVVHLLEIIASNYRLQQTGYHSAKEFDKNLLAAIEGKKRDG